MFSGVHSSGSRLPPHQWPPLLEQMGFSATPSTTISQRGATCSTAAEARSAARFQSVAALPVPQVAAPCGSFLRSRPMTPGTLA